MKPVAQTILAPPTGNCLPACVASLLELPLWVVPNFCALDKWRKVDGQDVRGSTSEIPMWWTRLGSFAAEHGHRVVQLAHGEGKQWGMAPLPGDLAIATVNSPRGPWLHEVVADMGTGRVAWDPNPLGWKPGHQLTDRDIVDWILLVRMPSAAP